jgi:hypothetical protein
MIIRLIIVITFCVPKFVCGQTNDLKAYYENIHKAELAIVDSNYASALESYQEAFKNKNYPFSQDLFNATLVSAISVAYPKTLIYLEKLFKLGFKLDLLDTIPICKEFLNSPYGKIARQQSKNSKPIFNKKYKKEIEKMVSDDQYFRIKPDGYKLYGDTIKQIDKQNVDKLLKLVSKYGFPSEEKIGISSNANFSPIYFVLIFHQNNGAKYQTYNYSKILKAAILSGELRNSIGAVLIEGADGNKYYDAFQLVKAKFDTTILIADSFGNLNKVDTTYETKWGYLKSTATEMEKYNSKRKEIYLEPIEESIKKIIFCITPNYFLFDASSKSIFKWGNYKDFLHLKNNLNYQ